MNAGYKSMIDSKKSSVYNTGIANRILQYMDKVRNVSDISQARRWVMELLQNCGDTAYDGKPVNVRITLSQEQLLFEHNGKPFRVKDILSIINQVSSKSDSENTVGRFGTGFNTTFQLSEVVEIRSVLSDEMTNDAGETIPLPFRPFTVTLDRRGRKKEDILDSIARSMKQLDNVDENELDSPFDPAAFNTRFTYILENEESRKCAVTGVTDLKNTVISILLFAPSIESVELADRINGEHITFSRGQTTHPDDVLSILEIDETPEKGDVRRHYITCMSGERLTLAAMCDGNRRFLRHSDTLPRIFTVFPMVGAEQFPFPVIINSRPNEPRSGITLVDNAASTDSAENKSLISEAVRMYERFLGSAVSCGFTDLESIVEIPHWREDKEMSGSWVKSHIYSELYGIIRRCAMINTVGGSGDTVKKSLSDSSVYIVTADRADEKKAVKELAAGLKNMYVPAGGERWDEALSGYDVPEEKYLTAEKLYRGASDYIKRGGGMTAEELVGWCSRLCSLSKDSSKLDTLIRTDKAAVFPCQDSNELLWFRLKTFSEIYADPGIPEILKEVTDDLDKLVPLNAPAELNIRAHLLHRDFRPEGVSLPRNYEMTTLTSFIYNRTNPSLQLAHSGRWDYGIKYSRYRLSASKKLVSCMKDKAFFGCCKDILKDDMPEYSAIDTGLPGNTNMWHYAVIVLYRELAERIKNLGKTSALAGHLGEEDEEKAVDWLVNFVTVARDNGCAPDPEARIYPDMKGNFIDLTATFGGRQKYIDAVTRPELYEISTSFRKIRESYDMLDHTINKKFRLPFMSLQPLTDERLCQKINSALNAIFGSGPLSAAPDIQQAACSKLLALIESDPEFAKQNFPQYSSEEDRVKLLTPRAVVLMQNTARKFENLCAEFGLGGEEGEDTIREALRLFAAQQKKQEAGQEAQEEGQETAAYYWNGNFNVLTDFDPSMTDDAFEELCRRIGGSGEKYVFDTLRETLAQEGYTVTSLTDSEAVLYRSSDSSRAVITRGDIGCYHQSGWDIKVTLHGNGTESTQYYEVKTHTLTSRYRGIVRFSETQMRFAMQQQDNFILALVSCDRGDLSCTGMKLYRNISDCIGSGRLLVSKGFEFIAA